MPSVSVKVVQHGRHATFKAAMDARRDEFVKGVVNAQREAAKVATVVSRRTYKRKRPAAPPRKGRTNQSMIPLIQWRGVSGKPDVKLDVKVLDERAPHWIIQEIGTNSRASLRVGAKRGVGRPAGQNVRSVKPQEGRRISRKLVWSNAGKFAWPQAGVSDQQLALASSVTGVPYARKKIKIKNEIEGQGFIKAGSTTGFLHYRNEVLGAARKAFRKEGTL